MKIDMKNLKKILFALLILLPVSLIFSTCKKSVCSHCVIKDSNGAILLEGDSVTLIKDLEVKGAGFTAKRGTAVRNIMLVHDNAEQIEGKVNGQQLVLLTKFVKKST